MPAAIPFIPLIGGALGALSAKKAPKQQTTTQGGSSVSQNTSSVQLPAALTGAADAALGRAQSLFGQGMPIAPVSQQVTNAAQMLQNLGTNVPGHNTMPTSSVFAGGQTINPYLDQVFNAAANATQNRRATEFANAGRLNSDSHQGARSEELQTLAAQIYGGGFESERQRQYGAAEAGVNRALSQAEANLGRDFSATEGNLDRVLQAAPQLFGIGQYLQQQQQQQLNSPQNSLDQYINQLNALGSFYPGTTTTQSSTDQTGNVTQPLYNSPLAGFAGGAQLGSYLGGLFPQKNTQPVNPYDVGWF